MNIDGGKDGKKRRMVLCFIQAFGVHEQIEETALVALATTI